jgi:hypothetical protein
MIFINSCTPLTIADDFVNGYRANEEIKYLSAHLVELAIAKAQRQAK